MKRHGLGVALLILPVLLLLGFAVFAAWVTWNSVGDTQMSTNGVIAMVLGVVVTLLVAAVLISLLLYGEWHRDDG
ncbi:MAG: hypothetical protein IRY87_09735 [Acetobacteraceae bacterium]|nr:hypothetical protein [Acetobacteraceae bacterium]